MSEKVVFEKMQAESITRIVEFFSHDAGPDRVARICRNVIGPGIRRLNVADPEDAKRRLLRIAALCLACVEWLDPVEPIEEGDG